MSRCCVHTQLRVAGLFWRPLAIVSTVFARHGVVGRRLALGWFVGLLYRR